MGSWSTSVMGGDTPLDIEYRFEERFGALAPSADEGLEFLTNDLRDHPYDLPTNKFVTAFLIMQRGAPMHDDVRRAALEGIAEEDYEDWDDPDERKAVLDDFAKLVKLYPADGGKVELPDQPGLFETILGI